ncbi:MAG: GNAT family N-acetyltransferase [Anaerolineae bacterium]
MADLLRTAFQDELGRGEVAWLHDMESLGALKPIIWLLNQLNIALGSLFYGFVWIENGRVVGNVTISRLSSQNWLISNVAVDPDYRRRGIARALMAASVDWIRDRNARWLTLEVRRENMPAKSLYLDMGFVVVEGTTEMERHGTGLVTRVAAPEGYRLRPARPTDGSKIFELARHTSPKLAQRIEPIRRQDYQIGNLDRLVDGLRWLIGLPTTLRWIVADADERVVAALQVRVGGRSQRVHLLVHPDQHGRLEEVLVSRALDALPGECGIVRTRVDADHTDLIVALEAHGFREVRTLDRMALELISDQ